MRWFMLICGHPISSGVSQGRLGKVIADVRRRAQRCTTVGQLAATYHKQIEPLQPAAPLGEIEVLWFANDHIMRREWYDL